MERATKVINNVNKVLLKYINTSSELSDLKKNYLIYELQTFTRYVFENTADLGYISRYYDDVS